MRHGIQALAVRVWQLRLLTPIIAIAAAFLAPAQSQSITLRPGDLVIADRVSDSVFIVDPVTGEQTLLASFPSNTDNPDVVAISSDGSIFVAPQNPSNPMLGDIVTVDPESGA
jgi:hypothetical protein